MRLVWTISLGAQLCLVEWWTMHWITTAHSAMASMAGPRSNSHSNSASDSLGVSNLAHNLLYGINYLEPMIGEHSEESATPKNLNVFEEPVPTKTIMDVLSSNAEFSDLVSLIQHHGLVPLINRSWNSTFLAPVNSAFIGVDKSQITRDQLLYHFIDAVVWSADISNVVRVYQTYLDDKSAPISLSVDGGVNNGVDFGEFDLAGSPQRGLVHSILNVLEIPPKLTKSMLLDPHTSLFASLVDEEISLRGSTIFVPHTNALESGVSTRAHLNSSEPLIQYLHSPFGKTDRKKVVKRHIYPDALQQSSHSQLITMLDGTKATIYPNYTLVLTSNGADFSIDASSGIRVARDGLYIKLHDILAFSHEQLFNTTAEKIMLGIGGYSLVRSLTVYGHRDLINSTSSGTKPRAIVVPREVAGTIHSSSQNELASILQQEHASFEHAVINDPNSVVLYQFLNGKLPASADIQLIDSQMKLRSGKYPQRIHFERRKTGSQTLNWQVLGEQIYEWGNTTFYTSEDALALPSTLTMALGPLLMSSYSLSYLDRLNRLQLPKSSSWTLFVPNRDAWERNMLLKIYLDKNDHALARIFDNLILKTPFYSDTNETVTKQFAGNRIEVRWDPEFKEFGLKNDVISFSMGTEVTDALFDNGVAHIVNDVPLPLELEISAADLIVSGERELFIDLLRAADMLHVLDPSANYTVLVPPPKELLKHNYTTHTDIKELKSMLELHLLPGNPLYKLFNGDAASTLAGEDLEVHALGPSRKIYGLSPVAATNEQRVLIFEYGFTNGLKSGGSAVVFIDRHISPEWIIPIKFGLRKGTYALFGALLGLLCAIAFIFGLFWFVSRQREDNEVLNNDEERYRDENSSDEENLIQARTG